MDEVEDWPNGRASALFMFAVFSGVTLVLSLSHWLSDFHISLAPLYSWEILLFLLTLASIVTFIVFRNNGNHVFENTDVGNVYRNSEVEMTSSVDTARSRNEICKPVWTRFPARFLAITICCIGSISMPVYETYRTIDNIVCFGIESSGLLALLILKFVSNIFYSFVCTCVLVFLLWFRNKVSKSPELKVLMSTIAATNFTLIVNVIMNIIWTSDTMDVNTGKPSTNNSELQPHINISEAELVKEMMYLKCINHTGYVDTIATYFYKYTYQFHVEFALFSFCFLGTIWNILPQLKRQSEPVQRNERQRNVSACSENDEGNFAESGAKTDSGHESLIEQSIPARWKRIRLAAKSTFIFCCSHIFIPTALVVTGIFAFHLYTEIKDDTFDDENVILHCKGSNGTCVDSPNSIVQTVYTYVFSIVAFIGFMVARKEKKEYDFFNAIDILLLIGAGGHLLLILFETIDNVEIIVENGSSNTDAEKVLFSFKTLCRCIGLYTQTIFVLKTSKIKIRHKSVKTGKQLLIKGIVVFLGVCNMEIWLADSFLEPTVLQYNENTKYGTAYGRKNWFFMTQLLYPLVTLYRLLTAVMCFEACVRFKHKILQEDATFTSSDKTD